MHHDNIFRGSSTSELEVLYKDFVERENVKKVLFLKAFHKVLL